MRRAVWLLLGLLSGLPPGARLAAAAEDPSALCRPRPEVAAAFEDLGFEFAHVLQHESQQRPCGGATPCWQRRIDTVEALLERYPADLFLHRALQDLVRFATDRAAAPDLVARYRALAGKHPETALYRHLLGRVEPDREKSREAQEAALRLDPDFVWSHLELAYRVFGSDGPEAAFAHLERFMSRCPDRAGEPLAAAYTLGRIAPEPLPAERLERLRAVVEGSSLRRQIRDLPVLWTLEFRAADPAAQPAVRRRILSDLARLPHPAADFDAWMTRLRGFEMAADEAALQRAEDAAMERFPCARSLVDRRLDRWRATRPADEGLTDQARRDAARQSYRAASVWTELCPGEFLFWRQRFAALSQLPEAAPAKLLADGRRLVEVTETVLGEYRFRRDAPHRQVAEQWLERRLFLDEAARLLAREQQLRDQLYGPQPGSSGSRGSSPGPGDHYRLGWQKHELLAAGIAAARGRSDDAEAILEGVAEALAELAPIFAESRGAATFEAARAHYWQRRGDLAVTSGARLDAMAFYRQAGLIDPGNDTAQQRARELWAALGGGPEGFRQLSSTGEQAATAGEDTASPAWVEAQRALPAFRLTDLEGKVWSSAELSGKVVFINLWATWCAPCVSEIPYLKRLAELLDGRSEMVLLTFNVDDNPGLAAPFAARQGIGYPVLFARDYVAGLRRSLALPISWILGPDGALLYEQLGFDSATGVADWTSQTLALLERTAAVVE